MEPEYELYSAASEQWATDVFVLKRGKWTVCSVCLTATNSLYICTACRVLICVRDIEVTGRYAMSTICVICAHETI